MSTNEAMIEYWNGPGGDRWVALQGRYDAELDPLSAPLVDQLADEPELRVLDVGCGCGSLSLSLARTRTGAGRVTGIDISEPMLSLARTRKDAASLDRVEFLAADAQVREWDGPIADVVVSRFGVMFFDDPVAAFANLRRATADGGRLRFLVWQPVEANEWVQEPAAIASRFAETSWPPADAPGPFAMADPDRIRSVLGDAGWTVDGIEGLDGQLAVGGPSGYDDAIDFLISGGPLARALADRPPDVVADVTAALTEELAGYYDGEALTMGYGTWSVSATR